MGGGGACNWIKCKGGCFFYLRYSYSRGWPGVVQTDWTYLPKLAVAWHVWHIDSEVVRRWQVFAMHPTWTEWLWIHMCCIESIFRLSVVCTACIYTSWASLSRGLPHCKLKNMQHSKGTMKRHVLCHNSELVKLFSWLQKHVFIKKLPCCYGNQCMLLSSVSLAKGNWEFP